MRLIDADELKKALAEMWYENNIRITGLSVAELIDEAPTIEPSSDLISREDALDVVCKELQYQEENRIPYDSYDSGACDGLKTARELLLALPSADRQTDESCRDCPLYDAEAKNCPRFNKVIPQTRAEMLADRPQVNSAEWVAEKEREFKELNRPKGEWIDREDTADIFFLYKYECSVCGGKNVSNSSYCPNCGAHMR